MAATVFLDNTVLCNFAAVHRLDLLTGFLRGRGRWTEAVADEARRSTAYLPDLGRVRDDGWLGEPIEIADPAAIAAVEHLRRDAFGGSSLEPRRHLGEAQTCYLIYELAAWKGSWWVSDDNDALDYARFRRIPTFETIDIVKHIVSDSDLTIHGAHLLMHAMVEAGRTVRLPQSATDLLR